MTKKSKGETPEIVADPNARLTVTEEDKAKSKKWFVRARELGEKRQYDYAVEYYVNGLEFSLDAVEEACKPLHGCAVARKQSGGKKPGLKDTMKRSMTDKDAKQAYVNSLWLFGHDPDNGNYIEGIVRNASRLRAEDAAKWSAGVCHKALDTNPKTSAKQYQSLTEVLEELGGRAVARGEAAFGVEAYQMGVAVLKSWTRKYPKDDAAEKSLRSLSTKLTILKGKYQDGESFRDSIVDAEEQKITQDKERSVQSDERVDELVVRAQEEYQAAPDVPAKLKNLVEMLCRRERPDDERKAIGLLVNEFKRTEDYRWKQMADDIRMKQLGREVREAVKGGNPEVVKDAKVTQLRYELSAYKERAARYPTDLRLKYELGVRYFNAGRFDDAIPLFQNARADPKNRAACGMYIGRCFFRKGYYSQAVTALEEAAQQYEFNDDDLAKTLRYWLGRSQEETGDRTSAKKTYGELLQMDYNYRDVRVRLDALAPKS